MAGLIAKPFFGAMADRFKRKKKLFLFFILLNLMSYLCVAFLPQNELERPVFLECGYGVSYIKQCTRLNVPDQCGAALLDSFKPPEFHEDQRLKGLPDQGNNASVEDEFYEVCNGTCEFRGFVEGVNFCTHVINHNVPQPCYRVLAGHPVLETPRTDAIQYAPAERDVPSHSQSHGNKSTTGPRQPGEGPEDTEDLEEEEDDRVTFDFKVKLKITRATLQDRCLYMPIGEINFDQEYRGLSCNTPAVLKKCHIDCGNNPALNSHLNTIHSETELLDSMNFWLYGSLVVIAWIAMAVVESLSDALCFQTLGDHPQLYGRQRLWGTIGWGTFSFISGYFIDTYSQGRLLKDYTPCFYLTAGLLTLDICVAYKWDVSF